MSKKLLLTFSAVLISAYSFGQYSQDFETTDWTSSTRGGTAAQATGVTTTNPVKTGINTTDKAFQITLTDTAPDWRWVFVANPGGTYGAANGTYYKFMFMSENETDVTIALEPWFSSVRYVTNTATFTGLTLNTWYEVEFNLADAVLQSDGTTAAGAEPGYMSRLDIKINVPGGTNYDGDIFYIDEIAQNAAATLSAQTFQKNKLSAFYNTKADAILFNNMEDTGSYKIYDLTGRALLEGTISKEISVSSLKSGLYILATDKGSLKFVK